MCIAQQKHVPYNTEYLCFYVLYFKFFVLLLFYKTMCLFYKTFARKSVKRRKKNNGNTITGKSGRFHFIW